MLLGTVDTIEDNSIVLYCVLINSMHAMSQVHRRFTYTAWASVGTHLASNEYIALDKGKSARELTLSPAVSS